MPSYALGTGNGGSIAVEADEVFVLTDSSVAANALEGNGGNIEINAEDIRVRFGSGGSPSDPRGNPTPAANENDLWVSFAEATSDGSEEGFVEARGWQHDRNGDLLLTATPRSAESCLSSSR